jgi:prepilin-type N-terminal cleavage/methylation domain-containing protein
MKEFTPNSIQQRVKGFTLVELLAVIALMLLVLQLTLPSLKGLMGSKPHLIARGQLISDLNHARTMALRNGAPVYVVFMPLFQNMDVSPTVNDINSARDPQKKQEMQVDRNEQLSLLREYLGDERFNVQILPNGVKFPRLATAERPKPPHNQGNEILGMQLVAYALYAEYLPGDQPSQPSHRWLSDWKRLPDGFYFDGDLIQTIHDTAEISGGKRLEFSSLKNGHDDGSEVRTIDKVLLTLIPKRRIRLPYIMYNSRGELAARGNPGEMRVGSFHLALTEGGLFQPVKAAKTILDEKKQKYEFHGFKLVDADRPVVPEENKKKTWIQINGLTGRADVLEEVPGSPRPYFLRVHTLKAEPQYVERMIDNWLKKNSVGQATHFRAWAQPGQWGGRNERGKWIFIGNNPSKVRPVAVSGIPRAKLMGLISYLQRVDSGIEMNFGRMDN